MFLFVGGTIWKDIWSLFFNEHVVMIWCPFPSPGFIGILDLLQESVEEVGEVQEVCMLQRHLR